MPEVRSCGSCTACCDGWLRIVIDGYRVAPGVPCPHSTGQCCAIYAERPVDPCRRFSCGWLVEGSPLPDWMRPDQSNAIYLPAEFEWHDAPVDVLVPCHGTPRTRAVEWAQAFALRSRRLLLHQAAGEWYAFGPPAFQRDMLDRMKEGADWLTESRRQDF